MPKPASVRRPEPRIGAVPASLRAAWGPGLMAVLATLLAAGTVTAGALLAAGPAMAGGAHAAPPRDQLQQVESEMAAGRRRQAKLDLAAAQLSRQITALRSQTIVAAKALQDHEEALSATEAQLRALRAQAAAKRALLRRRRAQFGSTLAALERLARNPPEALVLTAAAPVDAVRGALLLRAALPPLKTRVRALATELAELSRLHSAISAKRAEWATANTALKGRRLRLAALIARKATARSKLRSDSAAAATRLDALAREATDLRDLLARIEAARKRAPRPLRKPPGPTSPKLAGAPSMSPTGSPPGTPPGSTAGASPTGPQMAALAPPPPVRPFAKARGFLTFPARGRILDHYGQTTGAGLNSRGITLATRGGAQVVAPYDGEVVFAGRFRGYGQLLIIAYGEDYHILLAGLSRIDSSVGQWLLAGEPVGVMGPSENGKPQLYIELRRNGEPINPLPWMAARDEKVSG